MSRGRHRVEPAKRPLPRLPRLPRQFPRQVPRPVVAAGVGTVLLGVAGGVTFWPDSGSAAGARVVVADGSAQRTPDAGALSAAAALRIEERSSRDRTRATATPTPATPTPTPTATTPKPAPVPAVVAQRWVTTDVNVRSAPSADSARIGTLEAVTRVGVTGTTKSGWTQVVVAKRAGWVKSTYLATSKPKPAAKSAPAGVSDAPCRISSSIESSLSSNARAVYRAVCAAYGSSVSSFGGYRPGDDGDHGSGNAVDIMVSGDPGWTIARYVQAHARELGVTYVIYQQQIWMAGNPTSQWKAMEDRGSRTANHFDHVHVSVS